VKTRKPGAPSPGPQTKRCAIYTRKSTTAGLDQAFNSLDAQREACAAYIQRQVGWTGLDERYDDGGFTGANIERPAFQRLLADVGTGKIDVVVVYKVDRLSRSLLDFAQVMDQFNTGGAAFVSVTQNFSTADAMGRLTLNMLMSFAEFEREMIGERTRDKLHAARRKGHWTGGSVPLGYTVEHKKLVVHEPEAELVREIFALYGEHHAVLAVVRALHERNRLTKSGRPWTKNDVLRILKNPIYAGYMAAGDQLCEGEHSAVIERAVFARTQAQLAAGTKVKKTAGRNPAYLLRGVLHCGDCGAAFTSASTTSGRTLYRYYRCVTRDKQGNTACTSQPLPAAAIEAHVIDRLRVATQDRALAADVAAAVRTRIAVRRHDLRTEWHQLPPQVAALSAEVRRLVDTLAELTGPARRHVEARLEEVGGQLAACEARLAASERELGQLDAIEVEASWVADCVSDFDKIWDALTLENRGRLVRAVVQRVEVHEAKNQVSVFLTDLGASVPDAGVPDAGVPQIAPAAGPEAAGPEVGQDGVSP